jgi:5-methylcytosine-specific restriction endonuclease McrA
VKLAKLKPRVQVLAGNRMARIVPGSWRTDKQTSGHRGYDYRWQQARARFLAEHPLCQCQECDDGRKRVMPATVVDHRIPHRGDLDLFWDRSNWQAMSKACHDAKTGGGE